MPVSKVVEMLVEGCFEMVASFCNHLSTTSQPLSVFCYKLQLLKLVELSGCDWLVVSKLHWLVGGGFLEPPTATTQPTTAKFRSA